MEKLQPLITHRFWVLFGLAILVPLVSWFLYNGGMSETIETRRTAVDTAFSTANKPYKDVPNDSWINVGKGVNAERQEAYDTASKGLWLGQQNPVNMFWPELMKRDYQIHEKRYRWGEKPEENETPKSGPARDRYKRDYDRQHERVVLAQINTYKNGKGLCEVNTSEIHRAGPWATRPEWVQVWDAQEDQWLTAQLLRSLNEVNNDSRTIAESKVRQLHYLKLMGGNLDEEKTKAGGGGAAGGGYGAGGGDYGMLGSGGGGAGKMSDDSSGGSNGLGGGGTAKSALASPDLDFDETEEFGSPAGKATATNTMANPGGGLASGNAGAAAKDRRYVNDAKDAKYRTRGFKMKLTILQDSLPDVLAELTNSDWPIEIVRVHWEAANENGRSASSLTGGGTTSGGLGGGGASNGLGGRGFGAFGGSSGGSDYGSMGGSGGGMSEGSSGGLGGGSTAPKADEKPKDPLEVALSDPNLATVVIAGLITLFKADDEEQKEMEAAVKEKAAADIKAAEEAAKQEAADQKGEAGETEGDGEAAEGTEQSGNEATSPEGGEGGTSEPPAAGAASGDTQPPASGDTSGTPGN